MSEIGPKSFVRTSLSLCGSRYDVTTSYLEFSIVRFSSSLSQQCLLLRNKIFPHAQSPLNSADSPPFPAVQTNESRRSKTRPPSPLTLAEAERRPSASISRSASTEPGVAPRARSRSVSLSAEEIKAKGAARGDVITSKSLFKNREVPLRQSSNISTKLLRMKAKERAPFGRTLSNNSQPLCECSSALMHAVVTSK